MVYTLVRTALFALAAQLAVASPLGAAPSLKVEVTPPSSSVASVQDLKVAATITNTGSEAVKLLKYGTILDDKLPTKSFTVNSKDGKAIPFTGIKLSVSLSDVDDTAFTFLQPGESVSTTHDVSALYDFSSAGTGSFSFAPVTDFIAIDSEVSAESAKHVENGRQFSRIDASSVISNTVSIEVTADVAKRDIEGHLEKRASVTCSNTSRASFISSSYSEAKSLASGGVSYINSRGTSDSLYRSYWGANAASRVTSVLSGVVNENSSSRTLSCTDALGACSNGVIAYTVIATTNIYYCSIFFNEVATSNLCSGTTVASRNIRGGTTLHEITHAVSGTDDVTYGCAADQALSDSRKLVNADNYNCFTTQVYASTQC
ncbi:hypothetical protein D9611_013870 [Ephemerocybe angulata]|uniref:Neutral protease 2 n=1 Tax=Ephemerocybe angulata TaxID=980116 RepID=A0A8H5F9U1_9AGAR|nr:hypothetical protein D9611_013870 [Tulosesus angulatus]